MGRIGRRAKNADTDRENEDEKLLAEPDEVHMALAPAEEETVPPGGDAPSGEVGAAPSTLGDVDPISFSGMTTLGVAAMGMAAAAIFGGGGGGASGGDSGSAGVIDVQTRPTGRVTINGLALQGQTLTATNDLADANGMGELNHQWKGDGIDIAGATGTTLELTQSEVGKVITVSASYTDRHGAPESVASDATAAVVDVNDAPVLGTSLLSLGTFEGHSAVPSGVVGVTVSSLTGSITDMDTGAGRGIAITATNPAAGALFYSIDGGETWAPVGDVDETRALLLADDAGSRLYFASSGLPDTFSDAVTFRAWDQSSGMGGTRADVSRAGGATAFSITTNNVQVIVRPAPIIDLGSANGQLILPVVVEGNTYYAWDRDGDGVHGLYDYVRHDVLGATFQYDINGVREEEHNKVGQAGFTDNTYRYAVLDGVHLALPTYGADLNGIYASPLNVYKHGTTVGDGSQDNPTYDDMLAIWDALNGGGTEGGGVDGGVPEGWNRHSYLSATPAPSGHVRVNLSVGHVSDNNDIYEGYVALQVVSRITSESSVMVVENTPRSAVVYEPAGYTTLGNGLLAWSLAGADAGRFTMDADDGEVRFVGTPDFESPDDVGASNAYEIIVRATTSTGVEIDRNVTVRVTDTAESPLMFTSDACVIVFDNITADFVVYDANTTDEGFTSFALADRAHGHLFQIDATTGEVKFRASPSVTEDAIYQIEIVATRADLEITQAVSIALQDLSGTPATIDLGTYGQLILPVVVEGKTYYVWDRNADGLHNDSAVHGIYDHATHDVLDEIFKYDSRGVPEEGHNAVGYVGETDNTFRYAALNGLRVALPTYGGEMVGPYASSPIVWQSDTSVDNGGVHNPVYDDLLAIWDAHSISMPPYVFGIPPGWQPDYWSATPWYEGHTAVLMLGLTTVEAGDSSHYVALQVL